MTQALANNPTGGPLFPLILAGMPIRVSPLWWPAPATNVTDAFVADWSMVLAGIRKDVTLEPFREGVITDATGKVIQNLMQEDKTAIRATFRAGYYLATPPTGYTVRDAMSRWYRQEHRHRVHPADGRDWRRR